MAAGGIDDDFLDDLDDIGGQDEQQQPAPSSVAATTEEVAASGAGESAAVPMEGASTSGNGTAGSGDPVVRETVDEDSDEDDIWFTGGSSKSKEPKTVPPSLPAQPFGGTGSRAGSTIESQARVEEAESAFAHGMRSDGDARGAVAAMPPALARIARLRASAPFAAHMERIQEASKRPAPKAIVGALEAQPEYRLLVASNVLVQQVEEEQEAVHKLVADTYQAHFPELSQLVTDPLLYVKAVNVIRDASDLTGLDLEAVLPRNVAMGVVVSGSSTAGRRLAPEELRLCVAGCREALQLDEDRSRMLSFVESRMAVLAPNLSGLLGTAVAARLIGLAGGLARLSQVPGGNILVMGKSRQRMLGMSTVGRDPHVGVVAEAPVVEAAPKFLRRRASKVAANRAALAARVDCHRTHQDGRTGEQYRLQLEAQIEKWNEPPPTRSVKPLPLPDRVKRKRRGGQLARKRKAKFGLTDVRQLAGRTTFGTSEGEYGDVAMGSTLGMLSQRKTASGGSSRVVSKAKEQKKMFLGYKKGKTKGGKAARAAVAAAASGGGRPAGARGGLDTSLVLTPMVGAGGKPIDAADRVRKANEKYFAQAGTFTQVRKD